MESGGALAQAVSKGGIRSSLAEGEDRTGTNWEKRFIAQAGPPRPIGEPDYAGGIRIEPRNPNAIHLSSQARNPLDLAALRSVPLRSDARYGSQLARSPVGFLRS